MALFRSEAMFLLLSNFTGLKLHFLAPSEDEPEDKKERDGASAAENTEEGTSHSSSEPENSRGATSDSSLQSNGPTDPEEDEAKKGELLLCSVLILPLGIHNSVVYSFNSKNALPNTTLRNYSQSLSCQFEEKASERWCCNCPSLFGREPKEVF